VFAAVLNSPPSSLSSLQSLSGSSSLQALRPQGPNLTPSLANFYRDDLVNHVRGMPAELLEKQVSCAQDLIWIWLDSCFFGAGSEIKRRGLHSWQPSLYQSLSRTQDGALEGQTNWNPSNTSRTEVNELALKKWIFLNLWVQIFLFS